MEISALALALLLFLLPSLLLIGVKLQTKPANIQKLPPGRLGWPLIGESIEILREIWEGRLDKFVLDRVEKYNSRVFKTSLFGHTVIFMCGPAGNKFLFSNEGKTIDMWWPGHMRWLIGDSLLSKTYNGAMARKKLLMSGFFNAESLKKCVPVMDEVTRSYMDTHWLGKEELHIYPSVKLYTFVLVCRIFMSITEPELISRLFHQFHTFSKGMVQLPLNIPGTPFNRAIRARESIRKELRALVRQRRSEEPSCRTLKAPDILSYLLEKTDGRSLGSDAEIVDDILMLLFGGHDTSSSTMSFLVKYLGQHPRVHNKVLREQRDIAASKAPGKLLEWEDLQKMKYSEKVVSEVLRIAPPAAGGFREALVDLIFDGYTIPKGSKLCWSSTYTHNDPSCYMNAMSFDESRFEGRGPPPFSFVPFGGGPRMCLGREFARLNILVFLHNLVNRFDWDLLAPDEKFTYDSLLCPVDGLPVRLRPREFSD